MLITLEHIRQFTVARNFVSLTTLKRALQTMGFVQADPIRAPARAQDLILRHRVRNYHAGELERRYATLDIEEDFFVNYGFVTSSLHSLMHPRSQSRVLADDAGRPWPPAKRRRAELLLEFVRERGAVHPREVDEHFAHGTVKNYWGGSSNSTTHLLDAMQYGGLLRVARRENGIRIYTVRPQENVASTLGAASGAGVKSSRQAVKGQRGSEGSAEARNAVLKHPTADTRVDELVDAVVRIYAPLTASSLGLYVRRLRYGVPQWRTELTGATRRAVQRLSCRRVDGVDWYWPIEEETLFQRKAGREHRLDQVDDTVRLLAPFDPVVHDRARFELLWGWRYRFEAYTPVAKRKLGYYAMPLLWRNRVIGWGNLAVKDGELISDFGYVASKAPRERAFKRELESELDRVREFLGLKV
jgi:uncharacterized protein